MNPDSKRISPLRYLLTAKPCLSRKPLSFFRCGCCGSVYDSWTAPAQSGLSCCGEKTQCLTPREAESLPKQAQLDYDIVGGLNDNCVRVFWKGLCPSWLCLETFTGAQKLLLDAKRRPPAVFALAMEDAYSYCDNDPCQMCSFRCKNGFVLYAYYEKLGLFALPINRIAATSGSPDSMTRTR